MTNMFRGYAQNRGFQRYSGTSKARAINQSTSQTLRGLERQRESENRAAITQQEQLRKSFEIEQRNRQLFLEVETATAQSERDAKSDLFQAEIDRIDNEEKERTEIFRSLANVSSTAAQILENEALKRKKAEVELGTNLVLQYGLTGEEVQQLQTLEGSLKDFDNQQAPIISRLRSVGASELDINNLMQASGWRAHGQAVGAVQNAAASYDQYLAENVRTDVNINGVDMSLASAEQNNDVAAVAGILDRHRMNFVSEYLPGFDGAFIAKHGRESMKTAEAKRKSSMNKRMETTARDVNEYEEEQDLVRTANLDLTDGSWYSELIEKEAGGRDSDLLSTVRMRKDEMLIKKIKDGSIPLAAAEAILDSTVVAKHMNNQEVPFRVAFKGRTGAIAQAMRDQGDDIRRRDNNAEQDLLKIGRKFYGEKVLPWLRSNKFEYDDKSIDEFQAELISTGNYEEANSLEQYRQFTSEKDNDDEFDQMWAQKMSQNIMPNRQEVLDAKLSLGKRVEVLNKIAAYENGGLTEDNAKLLNAMARDQIVNLIDEKFNTGTGQSLPNSVRPAVAHAQKIMRDAFIAAKRDPKVSDQQALMQAAGVLTSTFNFDKTGNPQGIFRMAAGEDLKPDTANPRFIRFDSATAQAPIVYDKAQILNDHRFGKRGYLEKLYVDPDTMGKIVRQLNANEPINVPEKFKEIEAALKNKVPMTDIIAAQASLLTQQNASFKLDPKALEPMAEVEGIIHPEVKDLINKYRSRRNVDKALVHSGLPPLNGKAMDKPYLSFYQMMDQYNLRPELMPLFGAIMMQESSGQPGAYNDGSRTNSVEKSHGLLQINELAHEDKIRAKGYTMDDLRNPLINLEIAMDVWEERIGWAMNNPKLLGDPEGLTREEAEMRALDRWGAWTDGNYKKFEREAKEAWERYQREKHLPTWEQSSHMNPTAQQWIDMNGGSWKVA